MDKLAEKYRHLLQEKYDDLRREFWSLHFAPFLKEHNLEYLNEAHGMLVVGTKDLKTAMCFFGVFEDAEEKRWHEAAVKKEIQTTGHFKYVTDFSRYDQFYAFCEAKGQTEKWEVFESVWHELDGFYPA